MDRQTKLTDFRQKPKSPSVKISTDTLSQLEARIEQMEVQIISILQGTKGHDGRGNNDNAKNLLSLYHLNPAQREAHKMLPKAFLTELKKATTKKGLKSKSVKKLK